MTSSPDILGPWVGGKVVCLSREQESRDPRQPIGRRFDNQLVNQSLLVTSSVSVSPGWSVHAGSRCSTLHPYTVLLWDPEPAFPSLRTWERARPHHLTETEQRLGDIRGVGGQVGSERPQAPQGQQSHL